MTTSYNPMIQALLINVGSNSNEANGIAPIYSDGKFEYWPIQEKNHGPRTPRFKDLGIDCLYPNLRAHYDPRFEPTPTYGDIIDVPAFKSLAESLNDGNKPILLFASTLEYVGKSSLRPAWISPKHRYYIIGFFFVEDICFPSKNGVIDWRGHKHNAHYLRPNHDIGNVKVLVRGASGSRLLKKAFPISESSAGKMVPTEWLKENFRELRGGKIGSGPWYRRTFRNSQETTPKSILKTITLNE